MTPICVYSGGRMGMNRCISFRYCPCLALRFLVLYVIYIQRQNIGKGQDFLRKSIVNEHLSFSRNLDFYLYLNFLLHAA